MATKVSTKNYIYIYYQQIKDGSVTVGQWIERWYEIVVHGLENKSWYFDQHKANRAIAFIQQYCRHHEGVLAPQLITLEVWQKALISVLFGVVDGDGLRQFRECLVVVGRKNGKTLLDAAIACYMMVADGEFGGRAYFTATKLDQARLAYEAFYQMIKRDPRLCQLAKKRRTDVYFADTNCSAMPIAFSEKKNDGLNPSFVSLDELASWHGAAGLKCYEVFKSALGSRKQPLMFGITTAGYEIDGIYDELIKRATALLKGTSKETRFAPFLYMIDDIEKWNDIEEVKKANPNLGVSVSVDYILEEIIIAETSLSKRAEFICKNCCLKRSSSMAWFDSRLVDGLFGCQYTLEDFRGTYCLGGLDLSQCRDLTSACVLIQRGGVIYIFAHFWLPRERLADAIAEDDVPYEIMIDKGFLSLSGDSYVDYHDVYNWFTMLVEEYQIYPLVIGYDRYSAQYLIQDLERYGFHMESVFQGFNLSGIEDNLEGMMADGTIKAGNENSLLKIHFADAAQQIESSTSVHSRKKLVKISKNAHVDGVAGVLDALCMRQNHWAELADRLANADDEDTDENTTETEA